jgi:hypothetical protein
VPVDEGSSTTDLDNSSASGQVEPTADAKQVVNSAAAASPSPISTSNRDVLLELFAQDGDRSVMIAKSGLVKTSSELTRMTFIADSAKLSAGIYDAKFKVSFYDPENGEKALVEGDIDDVALTVTG